MSKRRKRTKAEEDYHAAWKACGVPLSPRVWGKDVSEINLRARLEELLKYGWPIQAIKDLAFAQFTPSRHNHVTPASWRWCVYFAHADLCGMDTRWLEEWTARQAQTV